MATVRKPVKGSSKYSWDKGQVIWDKPVKKPVKGNNKKRGK